MLSGALELYKHLAHRSGNTNYYDQILTQGAISYVVHGNVNNLRTAVLATHGATLGSEHFFVNIGEDTIVSPPEMLLGRTGEYARDSNSTYGRTRGFSLRRDVELKFGGAGAFVVTPLPESE